MIAHRLTTLKGCDIVYKVVEGRAQKVTTKTWAEFYTL